MTTQEETQTKMSQQRYGVPYPLEEIRIKGWRYRRKSYKNGAFVLYKQHKSGTWYKLAEGGPTTDGLPAWEIEQLAKPRQEIPFTLSDEWNFLGRTYRQKIYSDGIVYLERKTKSQPMKPRATKTRRWVTCESESSMSTREESP